MTAARPTAAKGTFPYFHHRTVAETDAVTAPVTSYCQACRRWCPLYGCEHIDCARAFATPNKEARTV